MRLACLCVAALVSVAASKRVGVHSRDTESQAAEFIAKAELELQAITISSTFDEWDYATNINEETKKKKTKSSEEYSKLSKKLGKEAQSFDLNQIEDYDVKRKLNMLKNIGTAALPEDKLSEFLDLTTSMAEMYSTAKVSYVQGPMVMVVTNICRFPVAITAGTSCRWSPRCRR